MEIFYFHTLIDPRMNFSDVCKNFHIYLPELNILYRS